MRKLLYYGPAILVQSVTLVMTLLAFYLAVITSDEELLDIYRRAFGSVNPGSVRATSFLLLLITVAIHILLPLCFMTEPEQEADREPVKTDCYKCKRCKMIEDDGTFYCTVYGTKFHKATQCSKMKARCDDGNTENT